jgi:hypothetical protein
LEGALVRGHVIEREVVPGTRGKCDGQFRAALAVLGVADWRATLAWLGVRAYSLTHGYRT